MLLSITLSDMIIQIIRSVCARVSPLPFLILKNPSSLSAFLAEATGDSKYTNAAITSANWIKNVNMANGLVLDSVDANTCGRSAASWIFTYNSGKFIEGLMVLGAVSGDSQWTSEYVSLRPL